MTGVQTCALPILEERAAYMEALARSDYEGLAAMFCRLSEAEAERMERFADAG